MKQVINRIGVTVILAFLFFQAKADVKLPKIFSSNMVLQQGL